MKKIKIIAVLNVLIAITSCSHCYYVPTIQNVPLFMEKNECRLNVIVGGTERTNCIEIQGAYSITNKFAVMANFMQVEYGGAYNNTGNGTSIEAAFGYFKPLDNRFVFEIYGGIGGSKQHRNYNESFADLSCTKIFIQPSIGLTFNAFDIAFSTSFSNLTFNSINNQFSQSSSFRNEVDHISQNRNYFFCEPAMTIRGGWKYVKLQGQVTMAQNLSKHDFPYDNLKLSVGLTFAFAERFRY